MREPIEPDPGHDLERFVQAQAPVYDTVVEELRAGAKRTHWMWFVFPQLAALGRSATARYYGIADLAQAGAYLRHPVLGPRLVHCARLVLALEGRSASQVFGFPDELKLRSCMTLFESVAHSDPVFGQVLDRLYGGERDSATLRLLNPATRASR